ncbi:MAG: 1-acyl-sn-glycerol-3-phosphate acyltransferase [Candidatus Dormibacteraeota bacterium]|nr:1-acyl-sn-glycerol-3-phosphate acyltransferase [Candidatus Dormibacteraeota bacterium]
MRLTPLRDLRMVSDGWHWRSRRPGTWAPREEVAPPASTDLSWARSEPVRSIRRGIQHGLALPFTRAMAHPRVSGREWLQHLDRPALIASNHVSHADLQLLLYALPDEVRDRTVVGAAADYWYKRPWRGRIVSLWLNTFPFTRTGGAQGVLHNATMLVKSGWHLVLFPEGTRSVTGELQPFQRGIGHLAQETGAPVIPMYIGGSHRIMPKGQAVPLPAPAWVRIGRPLVMERGEGSRAFTARVEDAVRQLSLEEPSEAARGSWIDRWRASAPVESKRR